MNRDFFEENKFKVQYFGQSGYTALCLQAMNAILGSGAFPERATIVTHVYNRESRPLQENHLFIFWNWQYTPIVIIPSGFSSGYSGTGPEGFALAICMIKDKKIPIDFTEVNEKEFSLIDNERILEVDDPLLLKIKATGEPLGSMYYEWVSEEIDALLKRGQLWRHPYLQGFKADHISKAISNVDLVNPTVGIKLRLARDKAENGLQAEEWQYAGLLIRDAWIELSKDLCDLENIDTSSIEKDKVIEKFKKLKLHEDIISLAKASLDLSQKVQHDRKITQEVAISCVMSSIFAMQCIIIMKYPDPDEIVKRRRQK